ncbi:MAG: VOC family protein [Verrucomicrobiales bacterium]|nr:VOC family protein [Verrucomicrobiales bacterium]
MSQTPEPTVAISLTVKNTADALDFYTKALGAKELYRMPNPDGGIFHAEFMIGNSLVYISDESPEWHAVAMPEGSSASCLFAVQTEDCDQSFAAAVEAGGISLKEPQDQFWGVRSAMIQDPFGYRWNFNHKTEDVSPEEMEKRAKEFMNQA